MTQVKRFVSFFLVQKRLPGFELTFFIFFLFLARLDKRDFWQGFDFDPSFRLYSRVLFLIGLLSSLLGRPEDRALALLSVSNGYRCIHDSQLGLQTQFLLVSLLLALLPEDGRELCLGLKPPVGNVVELLLESFGELHWIVQQADRLLVHHRVNDHEVVRQLVFLLLLVVWCPHYIYIQSFLWQLLDALLDVLLSRHLEVDHHPLALQPLRICLLLGLHVFLDLGVDCIYVHLGERELTLESGFLCLQLVV